MLHFHALLTFFMLLVFVYDVRHYIIPNWINLLILLLFPAMVLMNPNPVAWLPALYALAIVFGIGFVLFLLGWMGGGDVKLMAACAVWCGITPALYHFIVITAFLGGVLSVFLLMLRPVAPWIAMKIGANGLTLPRVLTMKQPLPYGLAIAAAFLFVLWTGQLPGLTQNYTVLKDLTGS